jgi:cytochrome c1
LFFFSKT